MDSIVQTATKFAIFGNGLIALSYIGLAILLFRLSHREKKFIGNLVFNLFGLFITTGAITRIMRIIYVFYPPTEAPTFALVFGCMDIVTGIIAFICFYYFARTLNTIKKLPSFQEVIKEHEKTQEQLENTRKMLEEVKEFTKRAP